MSLSRSPPKAGKAILYGGLCAYGAFKSSRPDQPTLGTQCKAEAAATQLVKSEGGPPLLIHKSFQATARQAIALVMQVRKDGMKFYYTCILQSQKSPDKFYIGFTEHLETRLKSHNRGEIPHTSKYKPRQIKTAIAFSDRQRALEFEEYLKSPSGRAFSKKRL